MLTDYYRDHGSLEEAFLDGWSSGGYSLGLDRLSSVLRGTGRSRHLRRPPAGYRALFPSPLDRSGSACKRLTLFVRWMVRDRYPT